MRFISSNMSSDLFIQGQAPILCQLCDQTGSIKWKCLTCELLMCGKCRDNVHSKFRTSEPHEIVDIRNVGLPEKGRTFNLIARCELHKGWKCCLYCIDCSVAVCPNCIAGRHKKHDMVDFAEVDNDPNTDSSRKSSNNEPASDISLSSDFEQLEVSEDLIAPTFITLNYVEKAAKFWFMPDISKTEALLSLKATTPGTFLIRKSSTKVGYFALVLRVENDSLYDNPTEISLEDCVSTYLIEKSTDNKYQFNSTAQKFGEI
ncbi:tensin-1-like [Mytilus edulis]|uniref:tensin-1-like n=1 Tax=Mytilus edulis TaxID=6550 RepID=UPI0039EDEF23